MTTRFPSPIPTALWAAPKANLDISLEVCLMGFPPNERKSGSQSGAAELSLIDERKLKLLIINTTEKQTSDSNSQELCPDPKTDFPKVIFLFGPTVEAC